MFVENDIAKTASIALIVTFFCQTVASAASVQWIYPDIATSIIDDGVHDRLYDNLDNTPQLRMYGTFSGMTLILQAEPEANLAYATTFVLAQLGDVVTSSYMLDRDSYFAYARYSSPEEARSDYTISLERGDSVYLAFFREYWHSPGSLHLGWLELSYSVDGVLSAPIGALEDTGPLIVGQLPIPEPSGGMLLLIGVAVLGLRRVKELKLKVKVDCLSR